MAFGLLLAGIGGNLTDRLLRDPGPLRGHVVDFLMLPHWPIFNVADMCINAAAVLILVQAFRGIRLDGTRVLRADRRRTGYTRVVTQSADHRTLPVPDGLAGERVDAAMAQMFGLSRTRAADLIARGLVQVDGAGAAKSDRVLAGADPGRDGSRSRPTRWPSYRRSSRGSRSSTTTPRSW